MKIEIPLEQDAQIVEPITIVFLVLNLLLLSFLFAVSILSAYLYATSRNQQKAIVFLVRNEKKLQRDLELWQSKLLQRAGAGALRPGEIKPPDNGTKKTAAVRHVSPSEAIENTKVERANIVQPQPQVTAKPVPNAVKTGFLKEAGEIRGF